MSVKKQFDFRQIIIRKTYTSLAGTVAGGVSQKAAAANTASAFSKIYNAAKNGKDMSIRMYKGIFTKEEAQSIYDAGKADLRRRKAVVTHSDARVIEDEDYAKAKVSALDKRRLDALAKITGLNIRFDEAEEGNARYDASKGEIVISTHAKDCVSVAMIHEVIHNLRDVDAESYNALAKIVAKAFEENPRRYRTYIDSIEKAYKTEFLDENGNMVSGYDEMISEEVVAEAVSHVIRDTSFVRKLGAEDRGFLQKIVDALRGLAEKIRNAMTDKGLSGAQKDAYRSLAKYTENIVLVMEKSFEGLRVQEKGIKKAPGKAEKSDVKYSLVGKNESGIEVYETSDDVKKLTYAERKTRFLDIMEKQYIGRTAKFFRNGHAYYAMFRKDDINKNIYGDKKSDQKGWKAKINVGADGDIFELSENSLYIGSKPESGKDIAAHKNISYWDYFIKTVQIDGRVFDLLANVRKGTQGGYVYSLQLKENKKVRATPPLERSTSDALNRSDHRSYDNSIRNPSEKINELNVNFGEMVKNGNSDVKKSKTVDYDSKNTTGNAEVDEILFDGIDEMFKNEDKSIITESIPELKERLKQELDWDTDYETRTKIRALNEGYDSVYDFYAGHEKQNRLKNYKANPEIVNDILKRREAESQKAEKLRSDIASATPMQNAQFEIIQKTNPMFNDTSVGIRSPKEIKRFEDFIGDGESFAWGDFSEEDAKKAVKRGTIRLYSSYPIKNGVFVSTSYQQALDYAGGDPSGVHTRMAALDSVAWINGDEGQYAKVYNVKENGIKKAQKTQRENSEQIKKSIVLSFTADDGTKYKDVVYLDRNIFSGLSKLCDKISAFRRYVYNELAGRSFPVKDENGVVSYVEFAKAKEYVKKDGSENSHPVLGKLAQKNNIGTQNALTHADELIYVSKYSSSNTENNHQWLDTNGWEFRTVTFVTPYKKIYSALLNIAKAKDGRKILYDINKIENIGNATLAWKSISSNFLGKNSDVGNSITTSGEKSNEQTVNSDGKKSKVVDYGYEDNIGTFDGKNPDIRYSKAIDFSKQVDLALGEKLGRGLSVYIGKTSTLLEKCGLPGDLPLLMNQSHMRDVNHEKVPTIRKYHGIDKDIIKRLPDYLKNPAMIYDSISEKNKEDTICVLTTELDADNLPIIVAVKYSTESNKYLDVSIGTIASDKSNYVTSMYGKDKALSHIKEIINRDAVLYARKDNIVKLLEKWAKREPTKLNSDVKLELLERLDSLGFDIIIHKSRNIVNREKSKTKNSKVVDYGYESSETDESYSDRMLARIAAQKRWGAEVEKGNEETKSIPEIISRISDAFEVPIVSGNDASVSDKSGNVMSYRKWEKTARTKFANDLPEAAAALGYHLNESLGLIDGVLAQSAKPGSLEICQG